MFCLRCQIEYEEDLTECPECAGELVAELPEPRLEYVDYIHVGSTFNPGDLALIKSVFDVEGIAYYLQGEHFLFAQGPVEPARIMIRRDQLTRARDLLGQMQLRYSFIGPPVDSPDEEPDPPGRAS